MSKVKKTITRNIWWCTKLVVSQIIQQANKLTVPCPPGSLSSNHALHVHCCQVYILYDHQPPKVQELSFHLFHLLGLLHFLGLPNNNEITYYLAHASWWDGHTRFTIKIWKDKISHSQCFYMLLCFLNPIFFFLVGGGGEVGPVLSFIVITYQEIKLANMWN